MNKQLSDEQLDKLMRKLVNDAAADDATINKIAGSPATWWAVQRQVNEQKSETHSPWPPVGKVLRWLMVGAPVAAAVVLIAALFVFRPIPNNDNAVVENPAAVSTSTEINPEPVAVATSSSPAKPKDAVKDPDSTKQVGRQVVVKPQAPAKRAVITKRELVAKTTTVEETKSDFIALSYARDPESGQIVRVKVPSSMMVSLGLVVSVEKPSDLVDAEVLVGDDGLMRAIRFIR